MINLKVKRRDTNQTKAKQLLSEGLVPGIMYGPKIDAISVAVDVEKLSSAYKKVGKTTLVSLEVEEKGKKEAIENIVLIRDVQIHPVTGKFIHVDFYQLPMDQTIEVAVSIEGINEAPGVKEQGGVLVQNLHDIQIKALPKDLISNIEIDLSILTEIGNSISVADLKVPDTVEILADLEEVVFAVNAPRIEEIIEEVEEEGEEDQISEIKTEGEEKREEKEGEEEEEAGKEESKSKKEK